MTDVPLGLLRRGEVIRAESPSSPPAPRPGSGEVIRAESPSSPPAPKSVPGEVIRADAPYLSRTTKEAALPGANPSVGRITAARDKRRITPLALCALPVPWKCGFFRRPGQVGRITPTALSAVYPAQRLFALRPDWRLEVRLLLGAAGELGVATGNTLPRIDLGAGGELSVAARNTQPGTDLGAVAGGAEARSWRSVASGNTQLAAGAEVGSWLSVAGRNTQLTAGAGESDPKKGYRSLDVGQTR